MDLYGRFKEDVDLARYYYTGETTPIYAAIDSWLLLNKKLLKQYKCEDANNNPPDITKAFGPATDLEGNIMLDNKTFLVGLYKLMPPEETPKTPGARNLQDGISLLYKAIQTGQIRIESREEKEIDRHNSERYKKIGRTDAATTAAREKTPRIRRIIPSLEQSVQPL